MAQDSWPSPGHNSRAVTDSEYEAVACRFSDDGVYGSPADSPVVAAGIGLTVDIRADVTASVRGHAWTSGSTGDTLTIEPNASSSTRIDRVVLRLDRSDWTVRAAVRQGTPGAAAPALVRDSGDTGVWEILLTAVTVSPGAGSVTVTRGELYVGARIRPALVTHLNPYPELGEMAWATDTQQVVLWNGESWTTIYDDSGPLNVESPLSAWINGSTSALQRRSGNVHLRLGTFVRAAGTLGSASESRLPVLIPSSCRHPTQTVFVMAHVTGGGVGRITVYPSSHARAGQAWLTQKPSISTGDTVSPGSASWAV